MGEAPRREGDVDRSPDLNGCSPIPYHTHRRPSSRPARRGEADAPGRSVVAAAAAWPLLVLLLTPPFLVAAGGGGHRLGYQVVDELRVHLQDQPAEHQVTEPAVG